MIITDIVQSFIHQIKGKKSTLVADTPLACSTAEEAQSRVERMSDKRADVVAIFQEYDFVLGGYGKLRDLRSDGAKTSLKSSETSKETIFGLHINRVIQKIINCLLILYISINNICYANRYMDDFEMDHYR